MHVFYEGRVDAADIDNLGHMNVRVYARKAAAATHALAAHIGLDADALAEKSAVVEIFDQHVRFYREQMEGNRLVVRAGVVSATKDAITAYLELSNSDNGDMAATFNNTFRLADAATRAPLPLEDAIISATEALAVDWPDHGRPRSIPLDPVRTDITLQQMADRHTMVRLEPYTVEAADCDEHGFMNIADGTSLAFAKLPIRFDGQKSKNRGWDDHRIAVATMESRHFTLATPRLGDTITTRSIQIDVGAKTMHSVHWSFIEETGEPVAMIGQIGLGFDLETRRSRDFPPQMRAMLEEQLHKEFA